MPPPSAGRAGLHPFQPDSWAPCVCSKRRKIRRNDPGAPGCVVEARHLSLRIREIGPVSSCNNALARRSLGPDPLLPTGAHGAALAFASLCLPHERSRCPNQNQQTARGPRAGGSSRTAKARPTSSSNVASPSRRRTSILLATTSRRSPRDSSIFSCSTKRVFRSSSLEAKAEGKNPLVGKEQAPKIRQIGELPASSSFPTATCTTSGIWSAATHTSSLRFRHRDQPPATRNLSPILGA